MLWHFYLSSIARWCLMHSQAILYLIWHWWQLWLILHCYDRCWGAMGASERWERASKHCLSGLTFSLFLVSSCPGVLWTRWVSIFLLLCWGCSLVVALVLWIQCGVSQLGVQGASCCGVTLLALLALESRGLCVHCDRQRRNPHPSLVLVAAMRAIPPTSSCSHFLPHVVLIHGDYPRLHMSLWL